MPAVWPQVAAGHWLICDVDVAPMDLTDSNEGNIPDESVVHPHSFRDQVSRRLNGMPHARGATETPCQESDIAFTLTAGAVLPPSFAWKPRKTLVDNVFAPGKLFSGRRVQLLRHV